MTKWQLHEAKARLSELLERVQSDGPQIITRNGKDRAVVLSVKTFEDLQAARPDFRDYLLAGPKVEELDIERSHDRGREIDL